MKRFYQGSSRDTKKHIFSLLLFLGVGCVFYTGVSALGKDTDKKQKESLENAVRQGIIHCYATEGHYPESLDYLTDSYGIHYDSEKYFIDYQILGANILPDVTIIDKPEESNE